MGGLTGHVFGYGSLAGDLAGATTARLPGYRRVWGVAADNTEAIPGYKQYRLRSDDSLPELFVAFIDLVPHPASAVNGIVAPVDRASLAELDRRERNYDRVDVTATVDTSVEGPIWTYVGSPAGRSRFSDGVRRGRAVVSHDYVSSIHDAFRLLGPVEYDRFLRSSELDGLPILDLERIDLPPQDRAR